MTTYTWPDTRAFQPQAQELRVVDNTQRTAQSSLSGYVQTTAMPGARWAWGLDMAPDTAADRAALEAFALRLSGQQHRVRLWDIKNPKPRGNIQLAGVTLGATAAQFATSVTLAGCAGANAVLGGSFETDANADGLADGWARYTNGTTGAVSASLITSGVALGAAQQQCFAAALGGTSADRQGVWQAGVQVAPFAGQAVTLSALLAGTAGTTLLIYAAWKDGGGASTGSALFTSAVATGGQQTVYISGTCPANAVTADVFAYQHSGAGVAATLLVDALALQAGALSGSAVGMYPTQPVTLLAGDWLGLTGGQLVRVVADATANDAGAMTVEVRHMLRAAVASGTAVTLDKPTALYVRTEAGIMLPRMAGNFEPGMSLDLVEVFA